MTGDSIRYAFSVDCGNGCWSGTASADVVVVSARRWWSIIATGATGRICWSPCASAVIYASGMEVLVLRNAGQIVARVASEHAAATATDLSKRRKKENSEGFLEEASLKVLPLPRMDRS